MGWFDRIVGGRKHSKRELNPDEVFMDATNLPAFDVHQFEGRIELPIAKRSILTLLVVFVLVALAFVGRLWMLQIYQGEAYAKESEENRLREELVFAARGVIYDRRGEELAWNVPHEHEQFAKRAYRSGGGFAHLLGYLGYPQKDEAGFYYQEHFEGKDGVEKVFNEVIQGENGRKLIETDARGAVRSESTTRPPTDGQNLRLSVDARVQTKLYELVKALAEDVSFAGGGGAIIDVTTGELLALISYPEYDSGILSDGKDEERIASYIADEQKPFLNRIVSGLYIPGSIIKPFIAAGVLEEGLIDPGKEILSTGSIRIPNPYVPGQHSVFNDWKVHGLVDMRHAIAVSSNVYFYYVGGGFTEENGERQQGLGIERIEEYLRLFGFGGWTGIKLPSESLGVIPSPQWKAETFGGDPWRIGDTYNTTIGQYGLQVTPLQVLRGIAAIANGGILVTPTLVEGEKQKETELAIAERHLSIVREGMRLAVLEGTALGMNLPAVSVAAKTGTAERGTEKGFVNSWVTGFFPYEHPRYAFVVVMEKGPRENLLGGVFVMRQLLDWMAEHTPEYTN